jgi:hypothetical protein
MMRVFAGIAVTLCFCIGLLATYGLTSKNFLESYIVRQESLGQGQLLNDWRSMNATRSQNGPSELRNTSPPLTMPSTMNPTPRPSRDFGIGL